MALDYYELRRCDAKDVYYRGTVVSAGEWHAHSNIREFFSEACLRNAAGQTGIRVLVNHQDTRALPGRLELAFYRARDYQPATLDFTFYPEESAEELAFRRLGLDGFVRGVSLCADMKRSKVSRSNEGTVWNELRLEELSFVVSPGRPALPTHIQIMERTSR